MQGDQMDLEYLEYSTRPMWSTFVVLFVIFGAWQSLLIIYVLFIWKSSVNILQNICFCVSQNKTKKVNPLHVKDLEVY